MVAIVYSSKTGTCKKYAESLSKSTGISVVNAVREDEEIVFIGWMKGKKIVGLDEFKPEQIRVLCVVGMAPVCDLEPIRKFYSIDAPAFYLRGAINRKQLSFSDKFILGVVCMFMHLKKMNDADRELCRVVKNGGSYYDEHYLKPVIEELGK